MYTDTDTSKRCVTVCDCVANIDRPQLTNILIQVCNIQPVCVNTVWHVLT